MRKTLHRKTVVERSELLDSVARSDLYIGHLQLNASSTRGLSVPHTTLKPRPKPLNHQPINPLFGVEQIRRVL